MKERPLYRTAAILDLAVITLLIRTATLIVAAQNRETQGASPDLWLDIANGPLSARAGASAVWTGSTMLIWGGFGRNGPLGDGASYAPGTDTWTKLSGTGAPAPRVGHGTVWTGSRMLIWGGGDCLGACGSAHPAGDGAQYDPNTDSWSQTSSQRAPSPRTGQVVVWTGSDVIVWGGYGPSGYTNPLGDGARYNPTTDTWAQIAADGAPSPRSFATAIWTGSEMMVWGGFGPGGISLGNGARYDPVGDLWVPISDVNSPPPRYEHTAVWTGTEMLIWGGTECGVPCGGARYDPGSDSWRAIAEDGAPSERYNHTAIWTGTEMLVWGGADGFLSLRDGGRYDPTRDGWNSITDAGSPRARDLQTAAWDGSEMIVWGGESQASHAITFNNDGARYAPQAVGGERT